MIYTILIFVLMHSATQDKMTIFDFAKESSSEGWYVVNDGVMGGLSRGRFNIEQGLAVFKGQVSTDNNGGFTMIQNRFKTVVTENHKAFVIKLKGDGKDYQFRVKSDKYQQYSYVSQFSTTGEWETITIPFSSMQPRFRGRSLDLPNFSGSKIEEVAFLIGNKRDEPFELLIRTIDAE